MRLLQFFTPGQYLLSSRMNWMPQRDPAATWQLCYAVTVKISQHPVQTYCLNDIAVVLNVPNQSPPHPTQKLSAINKALSPLFQPPLALSQIGLFETGTLTEQSVSEYFALLLPGFELITLITFDFGRYAFENLALCVNPFAGQTPFTLKAKPRCVITKREMCDALRVEPHIRN